MTVIPKEKTTVRVSKTTLERLALIKRKFDLPSLEAAAGYSINAFRQRTEQTKSKRDAS